MLDVLIEGGKIYDGTGNPWRRADVGIRGGEIVTLGQVTGRARRRIDARRLAVSPGFVDVHTHADGIVAAPMAENMLRQGVTTVVSGNCGSSGFPIGEMLDEVESAGPAINFATLVGHGTIRGRVMGQANRKPTSSEMARMRALTERAMREGALGMSTGLFYVPGAYAKTDEIVEIAKVVSARGGLYASHKRSAGGQMLNALREAATIGKKARIPIEISHLKILHKGGRTTKHRAGEALAAISRYRAGGAEMTFDVHPYPATFTGLASVALPPWVAKDGKLKERLQKGSVRRRIRRAVAGNIGWIGGAGRITIARFPPCTSLEGKTLAQVARSRKKDAVTTAMDLIVEGTPSCIFHALRAEDVSKIVCGENGMIASDAGIIPSRKGVVHPRNYGTFPRILREYVRERKLLSLAEAVRKMTSMPAGKFGIRDRGVIAVGMKADVVVFDADRIAERATFDDPHAFPVGLRYVLVNGHIAWDGRRLSRRRRGVIIRKS